MFSRRGWSKFGRRAHAEGHEAQLAQELQRLIDADRLPDLQAITARLRPPPQTTPDVVVDLPAPEVYDVLLEAA